ncbi:hypothetical protein A7R75_12565 [Mycolicibacterium llatzerense]|nr:hypothetical protein [Mycolicibacterium llatzerense]
MTKIANTIVGAERVEVSRIAAPWPAESAAGAAIGVFRKNGSLLQMATVTGSAVPSLSVASKVSVDVYRSNG